jgi:hypothetical protein
MHEISDNMFGKQNTSDNNRDSTLKATESKADFTRSGYVILIFLIIVF